MTFFIHPTHPLAEQVYLELKNFEGDDLFVSPRGEYDHLEEPYLYGIYINDLKFIQNYYRSGGIWGYEPLNTWIRAYEEQRGF